MGLIDGLLSGMGGILSYVAAEDAIDSQEGLSWENMKLQEATNAQNKQMFYDNLAWNKENQQIANNFSHDEALAARSWQESMYNKYQSPQAMMEQLKKAGINPYNALAGAVGGSFASSSSPSGQLASSSSPPNLIAPRAESPDYSLRQNAIQGISRIANDYFQNAKTEAETRLLALQSLHQLDKDIADIEFKKSQKGVNDAQSKLFDEQLSQLKSVRSEVIRSAKLNNDILESQNSNIKIDTAHKKTQVYIADLQAESMEMSNDIQRQLLPYQRENFVQQMRLTIASTNLSYANAANAIADKFLKLCVANGVKIDNFQKNQINWLIREGVRLDNQLKHMDLGDDGKWYTGKYNPLNTLINGLVGVGSSAAGAYLGAAGRMGSLSPRTVNIGYPMNGYR